MSTENPARIVTPLATLSYPYLFTPAKAMNEGEEAKYSCELIFGPGVDLKKLKDAVDYVILEKWGKKPPAKLRLPIREGNTDREGKEGYEDSMFISARSKDRPGVIIGPNKETCMDPSEIWAGCKVHASVTAFAYDHPMGGKGVSFALNNIWKIANGTPIGGRRNADQDFENVSVDPEAFGSDLDAELL